MKGSVWGFADIMFTMKLLFQFNFGNFEQNSNWDSTLTILQ